MKIPLAASNCSTKASSIACFDLKYCYLFFNETHKNAIQKVWGVDIERGVSLLDYISEKSERLAVQRNFNRAISGEIFVEIKEYGEAQKYTWESLYSPMYNAEGKVTGINVTSADITKSRQQEESLPNRKKRYQSLFDNMVEGFALCEIIFDEKSIPCNYRILEVNKSYEQQTGIKTSDIVGKTALELYPDIEKSWIEIYGDIVLTKKSRKFVNYNHNTDKYYETSAFSLEEGQFVLLFTDISEHKQSEAALQKSEATLNLAQKVAHFASWEWDVDSGEVWWSDELYRILGLEPGEIPPIFDYYLNALNKEDQAYVKKALDKALAGETDYDVEYRVNRKDGKERIVHAQAVVERNADGTPVRMIGTSHDITDRKLAEASLRCSASVFENTDEGIIVTNGQREIISVNKAFSTITGYMPDEVLGKSPRFQKSRRHDETFYKTMWDKISSEGRWQGDIWNCRKNGDTYPAWENINVVKDEQGVTTNYIAIFSDISVLKEAEERMAHLAHHDDLTGLPNRLRFNANLEQAIESSKRHKHQVALLFLDLDRFKQINDTFGHDVGDELLKIMSERLKHCVRGEDTVARIGGDEFTVVLTQVDHADVAGLIANKIIKAVRKPVAVGGKTINISASIGISIYPDDGATGEAMLKAADVAMYKAKAMGKNCFHFITPKLASRAVEYEQIEQGLRKALENKEFKLHYQPQVNLADGKITGVEALIRWNHPKLGQLLPDKFISIADDLHLIDAISEWVLRTAFKDYKQWIINGSTVPHIAVNITGRQISNEQSIKNLLDVIEELVPVANGMRLDLEVTEIGLERTENTKDIIKALRNNGVMFTIEDFGSENSSLNRLKQLPIDYLKIDQSFIRNIADSVDDKTIVAAIITMAHSLNLRVISEGVETQSQLDVLRMLDCDEVQGFYFSVPVGADEIPVLLKETYQ